MRNLITPIMLLMCLALFASTYEKDDEQLLSPDPSESCTDYCNGVADEYERNHGGKIPLEKWNSVRNNCIANSSYCNPSTGIE